MFNKLLDKFVTIVSMVILICIFVAAGRLMYFFFKTKKETNVYSSLLSQTKELKDKNDKLYKQIQQIQIQSTDIIRERDSLLDALKLKSKNVQTVTVFKQKIDTIIKIRKDTLIQPQTITKPTYIVFDTSIDIHIDDTLYYVEHTIHHLFKPDEHVVDVRNTSPAVEITEGNSFTLKEKPIWFTIGPSLQYNPFNGRVEPGISIQIPLFKIRKR